MPSSELHLHACALKSATEKILMNFAMPPSCMPLTPRGGKHRSVREKYTKLLKIILPKIELVTADGASDEQLTMQLLFAGELSGLKMTCRDLAHCSRRIANRSCFADDYLQKVLLGNVAEYVVFPQFQV